MRRSVAAMTALLLVSCSGGGGEEKAAGGDTAAADGPAAAGGGGAMVTMQPGQWEITTEVVRMSAPDLPQGASVPNPPPTTIRTCLTPEQAAAPTGGFLTGSGENSGCTASNLSMTGGRVQGTVQCEQPGTTMRSTLDGTFTPTSMEMNQRVETTAQGMTMEIESRTTGRRVGDCPG
jgi:hypothetical protein